VWLFSVITASIVFEMGVGHFNFRLVSCFGLQVDLVNCMIDGMIEMLALENKLEAGEEVPVVE
jgi:hypothetical protein